MANGDRLNRRDFVRHATRTGSALAVAGLWNARAPGANNRINLGIVGLGNRGGGLCIVFNELAEKTGLCRVAAVCDVWQRRVTEHKEKFKCDGYLDYRELVTRSDIDAVVVAVPDHWHARMALEAMAKGKDVYLEKPMCHTIAEAKEIVDAVGRTGRIVQVGSQTTSAGMWHMAKKAIADGAIGKMIMSQGCYHRNSIEGEWNWKIDPAAGPEGKGDDYVDWKTWLGPAPQRPWDPDRFFRFRKYWDYSGGIATDLFYHVAAPLNICWNEPQFPYKVMAGGSIAVFNKRPENPSLPDREVPDTFHLIGEYAQGHSVVLSSSMANSYHIPGTIRGHDGTVVLVEHGMFESYAPYITVRPEKYLVSPEYKAKFGEEPFQIPVEKTEMLTIHLMNFLDCVRSRRQPTLSAEIGAKPQVLISMAVQSYREGRVLYFDEKTWRVSSDPPRTGTAT